MQELDRGMTVAIIGGGVSGTFVAIQLLLQASANHRVTIKLVEPKKEIGRGVAYGTRQRQHVLNVRATNMSALPDQPEHFVRWLNDQEGFKHLAPGSSALSDAYAPRPLYGSYVQELFASAQRSTAGAVTVEWVRDEAVSIRRDNGAYTVQLGGGGTFTADRVVLALGNLPPKDLPAFDKAFIQGGRYAGDPWSASALTNLHPNEPVLLLGAGLTSVDMAVALHHREHRGPIHVISRRGLLPLSHRPTKTLSGFLDSDKAPQTVRMLMRRIRREVHNRDDRDWQSLMNTLRPVTHTLWQGLPIDEQRRFLRHLQTLWDLHRHRTAPEIGAIISGLRSSGQMVIKAGRVLNAVERDGAVDVLVRERRTGRELTIRAGRVINCTGSGSGFDAKDLRHTLLSQMLERGLIRADPLGLGLEIADGGRCVGASGHLTSGLYALGTLCKGMLWETVAVPELRSHAAALARLLLNEASERSATGSPAE
jgi:uncharacterized NAD(P)/FAD-binding protein YdhS